MTLKAPFPYFGGKRRAAPLIWEALGDPGGYIEPFAGSAAALLARPAVSGRRIETLNDLRIVLCGYDNEHDDLLDAGWRVIQGKSGSGSGYSKNRANGRRERLWLSPACRHAGEEGLW